jgi:PAS domain S-box-containing protein
MNTIKSTFIQFIKRKDTLLYLVFCIACLTLLGWLINNITLTSFSPKYKPISPIVGSTFISLSILLYLKINFEKSRLTKTVVGFLLIIITLFYCLIIFGYLFNFEYNIENLFVKNVNKFGSSLTGYMSPIASVLIFFSCVAIISISQNSSNTIKYIGGSLSLSICLVSFVLLISYLYNAPLLFGKQIIPISLPATICFLLLGISLLRMVELKFWTLNITNDNKVTLRLLKSFLPVVIIIVIIVGFLDNSLAVNDINPSLTSAIILLITVSITTFIIIRISTYVGSNLLKAEQALKENERQLQRLSYYSRTLIEASLDPLVTIDIDGKITDVNLATENATGLLRESLIGTDFSDYFTEPEKARVGYKKVFKEGFVMDYPLTIRNISNKSMEVLYNASVYRNEQGEILGVFAAARDVTKLRQTEDVLKIANKELSIQIKEKEKRTEELIISNKELETFSYSVSHDLRAPLRHINGYVDLLISRFSNSLPDKARHYLDTIADSSRQMGTLIDDLLQFSRIGRQEKQLVHFDMNIIVHEVITSIKQDNQERNIEWRIATLPQVYGDKAMLHLVWTNLLNNAVKFTRSRKKAIIKIDILNKDDVLIFSVHDNGVGFDMQYAHKLFGVFQRLHPTDEFEGTGIGLANVHHIILRLGGRTWAEAEPDKGATFYFSLPKNKEN